MQTIAAMCVTLLGEFEEGIGHPVLGLSAEASKGLTTLWQEANSGSYANIKSLHLGFTAHNNLPIATREEEPSTLLIICTCRHNWLHQLLFSYGLPREKVKILPSHILMSSPLFEEKTGRTVNAFTGISLIAEIFKNHKGFGSGPMKDEDIDSTFIKLLCGIKSYLASSHSNLTE